MGAYGGENDYKKINMEMTLVFELFEKDESIKDAIKFVKFLDANYPKFVSMVTSIYEKMFSNWVVTSQKPNSLDLTGMTTDQQIAPLNASQAAQQPES